MESNYFWGSQKPKIKLFLLFSLQAFLISEPVLGISPYENLLAKKNFQRAKNKIFSYVYTKYNLPTEYNVLLLSNIEFEHKLNDFFNNCIQVQNYSDDRCTELETEYINTFYNLKKQLAILILSYKTKGETEKLFTLSQFIQLQKLFIRTKKSSIHEMINLNLSISKVLIDYIGFNLTIKNNGHIYGVIDFLSFPSKNLEKITKLRLSELNNLIHDFIRREKNLTGKRTSFSREIDLALLFWNNVLKIKKGR